jgi:hypothetical protein
MKAFLPALLLVLTCCTAHVSHPTKTLAEQQTDIDLCTHEANRRYWMDPIAALLHAYDCLEAKGYKRSDKDFAGKVEKAVGEKRDAKPAAPPPGPCRVPCGGED